MLWVRLELVAVHPLPVPTSGSSDMAPEANLQSDPDHGTLLFL